MMTRSKSIGFLFAFLLIAGFKGACYVTVLTADTGHACCMTSAVDDDKMESACCDDFTPSRSDLPSPPVAIVIARATEQDLVPLQVTGVTWPETIRPPPRQTPATGPIVPRGPPLS